VRSSISPQRSCPAQFDQAAVIVVIASNRAASASQSDCQRQANIAKPDDSNAF